MGMFSFLPEIIAFCLLIYAVVVGYIYYIYKNRIEQLETRALRDIEIGLTSVLQSPNSHSPFDPNSLYFQLFRCDFENSYRCSMTVIEDRFSSKDLSNMSFVSYRNSSLLNWIKSVIYWDLLLLIFRMCCLGFFLGVGCIDNYIVHNGDNSYFFTTWNIELISIYYLLATSLSFIGVYYSRSRHSPYQENIVWSRYLHVLANALHVLYEVAASTAFFITTINFCFLNDHFSYWNTVVHFATTCSFIVECFLSSWYVEPLHFAFELSWAILYLIVTWALVTTDVISDWPYDFLETQSPSSFAWYGGLFVGVGVFYGLHYGLYVLKRIFIPNRVYDNIVRAPAPSAFGAESSFESSHVMSSFSIHAQQA